jgi:outer membrane protein TolC
MKMPRNLLMIIFIFTAGVICAKEQTLTFTEAANLAVAASADLRHSRSSQAVMEGAWKWGIMAYLPRMSLTISENDRLQQIGADSFIKNYGINIDQLIWDGGRTAMSRNLERMELDLSLSRLDRTAREIAESAIAAYRSVLSSRAILEIKTAALSVLEEQRRILNEEVKLGLALNIDLAGADISLADAKLDIISLRLDLDEMEKQFAELLGLDYLPVLIETVDIYRTASLPSSPAASALAREQNPDLIEARHSITKKQMELNYISRSWIPSFRLNGNLSLSGQRYPLTRFTWSVGISVEFSNPWFQNRLGAQTGWEPSSSGQYDRTAMIQNGFTPLPDPAAHYGRSQAKLALALEQEKYAITIERIGRTAASAVEKCALAEQKRILSLEAAAIGSERCRIEEIRLSLGYVTRLKLMETLIEQTQREIAVIQAATALLEAERELERLLDLEPGELSVFASFLAYKN